MRWWRNGPALAALVALAAHATSLPGAFLEWDDRLLVSANERVREGGLADLATILDPRGEADAPPERWREHYGFEYLPVRDLSYRLDRLLWGMNPVGYHLANVLLFALAAAALHGVIRALTGSARAALLGAMLFAAHPVATESVACIAHRKDVLMAAFFLTAWLAWLRDRPGLATALAVGAVLSKLPAIVLPGMLVLGDLALRRRPDRRRWIGLGAIATVSVAAFAVGFAHAPTLAKSGWHGGTPWTNALSSGVAFLEGVRLLLVPVGLHVGRVNETMTRLAPDAASLLGLALIVGLAVVGLVALVRGRGRTAFVVAVSALGLLILQLPYLQIRPFWVLFAERYLILALAPLGLFAGWALSRLPGRLADVAGLGIVAGLVLLTAARGLAWRDTTTLFTDAFEKEPRSYVALEKVARIRYVQGDPAGAKALASDALSAARELRPLGQNHLREILVNSHLVHVNAFLATKDWDGAARAVDEFEKDAPERWQIPFLRGNVAQQLGRAEEAERLYREALARGEGLGENAAVARHNLAILWRGQDGLGSERAARELEAAVGEDPDFADAWFELARYHGLHRRWEEVVRCLRAAIAATERKGAEPPRPWLGLLVEVLERRLGRPDEALEIRRLLR
jgi:hypothetical protein